MKRRMLALCLLIVLLAPIMLLIQTNSEVNAQTAPSIPVFTLKYVDNSYDVPPTYGIDPYTGQNVPIQEGYHVDGRTVEFTIKNQPFAPYNDTQGNSINLYYNFRFKGSFGSDWTYYPFEGAQATRYYEGFPAGLPHFPYFGASNSGYTITTLSLQDLTATSNAQTIPYSCQLDFQVQAQIGHIDSQSTGMAMGNGYSFTGQTSGWSNIQTISIPDGSVSITPFINPTPSPSPSPTPPLNSTSTPEPQEQEQPQQTEPFPTALVAVASVISAVIVGTGLLVYFKKRKYKDE